MINLEKKHLKILKEILSKYPYTFYLFGSRTKGKSLKFSDIDLCYKENIPHKTITNIKFELEDSDLPFFVDLVDFNNCTPDFQKLIEKDLAPLTP